MILVTGAAGKTGRAVIRALAAAGRPVRGLVRRPGQADLVRGAGARETVVADLLDAHSLAEATRGVRAIYHICPNINPDEVTIGRSAIAAAQAAGVERFVYHSVLHPQAEAMPHHWLKLRVEEMLFESGLSYTILQPAAYMQNVLAYWPQITGEGLYPVPYSTEAQLSLVDLADVAAVALRVLTEPGHADATYELAGPEALSAEEVTAILARHLGRPVRAEAVSPDTWEDRARAAGMGEYQMQTLLAMFRYYDLYGLTGNPRVLAWLLGRPPGTFAQLIGRTNHEAMP